MRARESALAERSGRLPTPSARRLEMRKQRAVCALAGMVAIGVTAREIGANLASLLQMLVQNAVQSGVSIAEAGDPSGPLHRRAQQQRAGADEEDGQFPWALICIIVILVVGYSCAIFCVVFRQQFEDAAASVEEQAAQQGEEGAAKHAPSSPKVLGPFGMLVPKSPSPRRKAAAAAASCEGAEPEPQLHLVALPGAAALGTPERGA